MKKHKKSDNPEQIDLSRRKALSRLGMAATAIYAAPVLMTLSQSAQASSAPSAPSAASAPSVSAPSVSSPSVSAPSAASAPSAPDVTTN